MSTYLTFKTGELSFAVGFADVIRIIALEDIAVTAAPNFPEYMPGTAAVDGEAVPVIDTAVRFGLGGSISGQRACCILSRLAPDAKLPGRYDKCAVLVEEVTGITEADELSPPPSINSESFARYMKGTFISEGVTYYVISPELLAS